MAIDLPHLPNPAAWFAHHDASRTTTEHRRIGQWRLEITRDPFASTVQCRLQARGMSYGPAAMTFQFSAHTDTFDAVYRIDGGPPISWRVNAMTLASRGVPLQTDSLNNASGGRVFVPTTALTGAQTIAIRPSPTAPARIYRLDDLSTALAAAQSAGCAPQASAVTSG